MKKSAKGLQNFGLDCGMLEFFTHEPYPTFLEHGLSEKITVCAHTNRDPNKKIRGIFVFSGSELFQILKTKIKK
jgi:hypothetical protein